MIVSFLNYLLSLRRHAAEGKKDAGRRYKTIKSDLFRKRLVFVNVFFSVIYANETSDCSLAQQTLPLPASGPHRARSHAAPQTSCTLRSTTGPEVMHAYKIKARQVFFNLLPGEIQTFHQSFIYVLYCFKGNTLVKIDTIIFLIELFLRLNQNDALQFGY